MAKARDTQEIADDAQRDLDEALPALDAALASLKSLNRNDVVEVCYTNLHCLILKDKNFTSLSVEFQDCWHHVVL